MYGLDLPEFTLPRTIQQASLAGIKTEEQEKAAYLTHLLNKLTSVRQYGILSPYANEILFPDLSPQEAEQKKLQIMQQATQIDPNNLDYGSLNWIRYWFGTETPIIRNLQQRAGGYGAGTLFKPMNTESIVKNINDRLSDFKSSIPQDTSKFAMGDLLKNISLNLKGNPAISNPEIEQQLKNFFILAANTRTQNNFDIQQVGQKLTSSADRLGLYYTLKDKFGDKPAKNIVNYMKTNNISPDSFFYMLSQYDPQTRAAILSKMSNGKISVGQVSNPDIESMFESTVQNGAQFAAGGYLLSTAASHTNKKEIFRRLAEPLTGNVYKNIDEVKKVAQELGVPVDKSLTDYVIAVAKPVITIGAPAVVGGIVAGPPGAAAGAAVGAAGETTLHVTPKLAGSTPTKQYMLQKYKGKYVAIPTEHIKMFTDLGKNLDKLLERLTPPERKKIKIYDPATTTEMLPQIKQSLLPPQLWGNVSKHGVDAIQTWQWNKPNYVITESKEYLYIPSSLKSEIQQLQKPKKSQQPVTSLNYLAGQD